MKATIVLAAERELEEAVEYYEARSADAAGGFLDEYLLGLQQIIQRPTAWPEVSKRARAYRLHRYPYSIVYQILEDRGVIRVVAVAHAARYWRDRIG